jgi:hypothetical protein
MPIRPHRRALGEARAVVAALSPAVYGGSQLEEAILQEDGAFLLQEDGSYLLLEDGN